MLCLGLSEYVSCSFQRHAVQSVPIHINVNTDYMQLVHLRIRLLDVCVSLIAVCYILLCGLSLQCVYLCLVNLFVPI